MAGFCAKVNASWFILLFVYSAGHERVDADHWLAGGGGLCRQLVWEGEVSTARCATRHSPADDAV